MKRLMIKWTPEEREYLVDLSFNNWVQSPGLTLMAALMKAQEKLPINRRRKTLPKVEKWYEEAMLGRAIKLQEELEELRQVAAEKAMPQPEPPSPEELIQMVATENLYSEIMRRQDMRDEGIARMMQTVEDKLEHVVKLVNRISSIAGEDPNKHISPPKPKVLVVGILPGQLEELRKQTHGVQLGMVSSQTVNAKIPAGYDIAFCTRWCRHAMSETAKKLYGHKYFWHDGGLDSLARRITAEVAVLNGAPAELR